ncbi:molybdopterin-dependent oxidoreductase [Proteinivorax hydrogeniformans]|uniref:Molybdopterin-dependent oxidoreductase n=1 Tax=Proteinivorax hydrogeniformans TaxID=1826727 RepID=A0AAU8HRW0_9FIRM
MRQKLLAIICVLLLTMGAIVGCSTEEKAISEYPTVEDVITILSSSQGKTEISVMELMELQETTEKIIRRDDDGEIEEEYTIKGALFEDVLKSIDQDIKSIETIRLTASDGYSLEVPNHILAKRDIILAYEIKGDPLHEESRPIRVFIPEEESMYWVSSLVEIKLENGEPTQEKNNELGKIKFFESVISEMEELPYDGSEDKKSVKGSKFLEKIDASGDVYMLATDGFDKNEEYETFKDAFIVTQGENTPAFRSPDLPRGMHVRDLVWLSVNNTGVFSVERGKEIFDEYEVGENNGINLQVLVEEYGLKKADKYLLEAADGFSAEVTYEDLASGIVYIRESKEVASEFDFLPRNTAVRDLLFIKPIN